MIRKIAAALGCAKRPTAAYVMKHPVKGAKASMASYGGRSMTRGRAGLELGAAIGLPLAFLAVRRKL
jgi:hypothetical protein